MAAVLPEMLAAAFERLACPVIIVDLTGRVVVANAAYRTLVRRSAEDLDGALSLSFVHPDDWFPLVTAVLSLVEGRAERAVNTRRHLRPDGTVASLTITVSLLHIEGEPPLLLNEVDRFEEVPSSDDLALARTLAIHNAIHEGISIHDAEGRLLLVTQRVEDLLGRPAEQLLGRRWTDSRLRPVDPDGRPVGWADDPVAEAARTQTIVERTLGIQRADGRMVWLLVRATPLPGGGAVSSLGDLTDLVAAEEDRSRLAGIVQRTIDLVVMWNPDGRMIYLNASARQVLGLDADQDPGCVGIKDLLPPNRDLAGSHAIIDALREHSRWTGDLELSLPGGRVMPVTAVVLSEVDENGLVCRFSAVAHDRTSQVQLEAELEHRATTDPLTGLANRWLLNDQLATLLISGTGTVVYLDLDDFKGVNDSGGHAAGDRVLVEVARCLRDLAPPGALVSRAGGDEFVVVLPPGTPPAALLEALPVALGCLGVQASVGVAEAVEGDDGARLLARADEAMYGARGRSWATDSIDS